MKQHKSFKEPEDVEAKIWRYLDLAKFLAMIEKKTLFFCRIDKLGDPFEGSRPRGEDTFWAELLKKHKDKEKIIKSNRNVNNEMRRMCRQECTQIVGT